MKIVFLLGISIILLNLSSTGAVFLTDEQLIPADVRAAHAKITKFENILSRIANVHVEQAGFLNYIRLKAGSSAIVAEAIDPIITNLEHHPLRQYNDDIDHILILLKHSIITELHNHWINSLNMQQFVSNTIPMFPDARKIIVQYVEGPEYVRVNLLLLAAGGELNEKNNQYTACLNSLDASKQNKVYKDLDDRFQGQLKHTIDNIRESATRVFNSLLAEYGVTATN